MTKQSRKELLKHDDAFIVAAGQATTWFTEHRTPLIGGVGALLVLALGFIGFSAYGNSQSKEASRHFAEGWKLVEARTKPTKAEAEKIAARKEAAKAAAKAAGEEDDAQDANAAQAKADKEDEDDDDRPLFDTSKDKWSAARTAFAEAERVTGRKGVGAMAALMVGDLSDRLGEHDKAEQEYAALRQDLPQKDSLSFLPVERFAYAREAAGDLEGAIAALNDLAADEQRFYADYAQLHQARLFLAKGDKDKARTMLEHIVQAFPETSLEEEVKAKLAELGGSEGMAQLGAPAAPADTNTKAMP